MMIEVLHGSTRYVLLVGDLAFKLPSWRLEWRLFLRGLLANIQERQFWKFLGEGSFDVSALCPILFSVPGGWLVVMRRAQPLTQEQFDGLDLEAWCDRGDWVVPVERKVDSFGWVDGRLVAVDYGN